MEVGLGRFSRISTDTFMLRCGHFSCTCIERMGWGGFGFGEQAGAGPLSTLASDGGVFDNFYKIEPNQRQKCIISIKLENVL